MRQIEERQKLSHCNQFWDLLVLLGMQGCLCGGCGPFINFASSFVSTKADGTKPSKRANDSYVFFEQTLNIANWPKKSFTYLSASNVLKQFNFASSFLKREMSEIKEN